jgi:membrane fusion protein (multidrug efflux system)
VAQAEAGVLGAQAALDNLANQIELQYATIAQAQASQTSAEAAEVQARQEYERQQSLSQSEAGTRQRLEQATAAYAKAQGFGPALGCCPNWDTLNLNWDMSKRGQRR